MEALTKFMGRKPDSRAFIKALKAPASRNQTFWRRLELGLELKMGFDDGNKDREVGIGGYEEASGLL